MVGVERETAELEDDVEFFVWAAEKWPSDRFTVELDPWELSPSL